MTHWQQLIKGTARKIVEKISPLSPGLKCPMCGGARFRVQQTLVGQMSVVRARVCLNEECCARFITEEKLSTNEVYREARARKDGKL